MDGLVNDLYSALFVHVIINVRPASAYSKSHTFRRVGGRLQFGVAADVLVVGDESFDALDCIAKFFAFPSDKLSFVTVALGVMIA
jgi:hypothetical protein